VSRVRVLCDVHDTSARLCASCMLVLLTVRDTGPNVAAHPISAHELSLPSRCRQSSETLLALPSRNNNRDSNGTTTIHASHCHIDCYVLTAWPRSDCMLIVASRSEACGSHQTACQPFRSQPFRQFKGRFALEAIYPPGPPPLLQRRTCQRRDKCATNRTQETALM